MISAFNTIKLRHLLKDFYQITHIRITVFDENRTEIVSYPDQIAPFCQIVRSTESNTSHRAGHACGLFVVRPCIFLS